MAFLKFLFCEKLKKFKSSLSFQIYITYDLKNQVCDIYNLQFYICNLVHFSWLFVSTNMSTESRTLTLTNFYSFFVLFQQPSGLEQDISYLCLKTSAVTLSPLIYEHVRLIIFRKKNSAYPMLLKPTLLLGA